MSDRKTSEKPKLSNGRRIVLASILLLVLLTGAFVYRSSRPEGERRYQNPPDYVQISNEISTHGYDYYTSPVLVDENSSRKEHIAAMIKTAESYLGDPYVNRESGEPGKGVDCSGLVMQACYGAGVDLWPSNPYRHKYGEEKYEWESREIAKMDGLKSVPYEDRERGDLIFYANDKEVVVHVGIYLGKNRIIHSSRSEGGVVVSPIDYTDKAHVCLVRRIFN